MKKGDLLSYIIGLLQKLILGQTNIDRDFGFSVLVK